MDVWIAIMVLVGGLVLLFVSSDRAVDALIKLALTLGASVFAIGFVVSAIGSDLPEIVNSVISASLGHGAISVGDSL
ncbi:MAG: sodium:calcium antiporter, partial [Candidatus Bathyarchaeota archaeon]